ncbi:valine--tRNA ligase [Gudongella oleilytica]|jgi:valyl-tRNA synthetase|uniref:valine--tRNA ligase n=1 Tax=Gudongella oleilytica TaxID=1582259 RepID=UPI000FF8814F|nr:valine--tRNA ligase [Gudongella oleilytica]MDY0257529.1 valine--tRNA ligase [Gudongella oleilytica]HMM69243.1 valine--tRNA ligase [Gudongella oleilytica]
MLENLPKNYDPKEFEDRLYKFWNDNGYFTPEIDKNKKPYTIMMPPPNVTGSLHMGHALNNTIQDVLIRWKRMEGYSALWLPGTDHASISTEAKVVEKIKSEGKSKEELGREGFLKEAWAWTDIYGGTIKNQLKKLGVSCDWSRDRFTLDEMLSNAVEEVFVRLYDKGLIYRGDRIINWCPSCHTAISDAEVDHEDAHGYLWHVKYPIKNSDQFITIATTRPETILGDLAVAVHPDDDRYSHLVGKTALVPIINREIPVIADPYVEMEFGTGALKITPSHDPNDFEVGERHGLGQCVVINEDGFMNSNAAEFEGLERFEARKTVAKALEERGYLETVKDHDNAVGHCERCKTIIEPLISKQWFVRMEPLAKPSLEAYYNGELRFIPERFGKVYTHWLENIKDWCISRQLWWGHRLPVYYCDDCGEIIVSREKITKCSKCESTNIRQETDTLDTWFSSALWPFSTLGWPEDTEDMDYFFPTDVLVTGYDIIFFWVIRMVFSSLEQTGELPFKDVFLTGLVRDSLGRKMSKSLGNGIDPLELIEEYGADALRFTLVTGNTPGNDMRFYTERVEASRNFANKLWNATRFVMMNLDDETEDYTIDTKELEPEDKWIITRLNKVIGDVKSNLDKYELGLAAQRVYDFIWEDYCDWYIEMTKTRLYGEDKTSRATAQQVLVSVLRDTLKLLHPFMPFITEEIWQHLPGKSDALIMEAWPKPDSASLFEESEKNIEFIKSAIKGIRNARAEMNIVPSRKAGLIFVTEDESLKEIISQSEKKFRTLASADSITFTSDKSGFGEGFVSVVLDGCEVFLPLADLIDFDKELERLEKEKAKLEDEIKRVDAKLSNQGFVAKAPAKVVDEEKEKQIKYKQMLENVLERINSLKK